MNRRGHTMVEITVVVAITAAVVGSMMAVYSFIARRTDSAFSESIITLQMNSLAEILRFHIGQASAVSKSTNSFGDTLRITLPSTGTDGDADGHLDQFTQEWMGNTGLPHYGSGERVTYYMAPDSGNISGTSGDFKLWRAWRPDDTQPGTSDKDSRFGDNNRWTFIESVSYSVDAPNQTVTVTIVGSRMGAQSRKAKSTDTGAMVRRQTLVRKVFYRGRP